jgi:hypothetical protein
MHEPLVRDARVRTAQGGTDRLRARIAILLSDPGVASRVSRRLAPRVEAAVRQRAGTPPCLRATNGAGYLPALLGADRCRAVCRSVDCLCGRYPRALSEQEIVDGRLCEPLAV